MAEIIPATFPNSESELGIEAPFQTLHGRYDERFAHPVPGLSRVAKRLIWSSIQGRSDREAGGSSATGSG